MLNVYDILLNFLDGDRVYEFFEWSNKDDIEHIKKIPMIKVSTECLEDMMNHQVTVEKVFLKSIDKKCEVYTNDKVSVIDYAALFTDGFKVLGAEFSKDGKLLYRSFLLLDEEEEILEIGEELKITNIEYKKVGMNKKNNFLTREEEYHRNYLVKELKYAYKKKMTEKINYLYEEIFPTSSKSFEEKYQLLMEDIERNFSDKHNELFKILKLTHKKNKTASN